MFVRTMMLTCAMIVFGQAVFGQEPVLRGEKNGGTYKFGDAQIRYFVFTFKSDLDRDKVRDAVSSIVRDMQADGTSSEAQCFSPFDKNGLSSKYVSLTEGDVLVLGWANREGTRRGWIAADKKGIGGGARHRWISESGKSGTIVASSIKPRRDRIVVQHYRTGTSDASKVYLQFLATDGYLRWFMKARPDDPAPQ